MSEGAVWVVCDDISSALTHSSEVTGAPQSPPPPQPDGAGAGGARQAAGAAVHVVREATQTSRASSDTPDTWTQVKITAMSATFQLWS